MARIVVIGDLMTDTVAHAMLPLARGSDTPATVTMHGGGSGANVAAWLAADGADVAFIGRRGADIAGRNRDMELMGYGVDARLVMDPERPTGTCVVMVTHKGERTMLSDPGANAALSPDDLPHDLFVPGAHLHVSGYTLLAEGSRNAALAALEFARRAGMSSSVDAASAAPLERVGAEPFLELSGNAMLLFVNMPQARILTGRDDPEQAARVLTAWYPQVVIKLGKDGALFYDARANGRPPVHVPAPPMERVIDGTGAGDAFVAGFLPPWLDGKPPAEALSSGHRLAGHAMNLIGARPVLLSTMAPDTPAAKADAAAPEDGGGSQEPPERAPRAPRTPAARQRRTLSDRLPRAWMFPLLAFGAAWALIVATWNVCNHFVYHESHGWYWWFWYKDSGFYWSIANHWYAPQANVKGAPPTGAFFPVYPALIRLCYYPALGNKHVAGLLATIIAGAAAAMLVWALAARVRDRWVADRTVLLFCAFPGAMMLGMMYAEALGVALTAACLLMAVQRRWFLAGLFGLLATAEHPTLVVIVPTLAIVALHAVWTRRDWRSLIAPALAPLGILGYFAWIGTRYHDYGFWFRLERKLWGQKVDFGRTELRLVLHHWGRHTGLAGHTDYNLLCIAMLCVLIAGVVLMLVARLPLPITAYTLLLTLSLLVSAGSGPRPRYVWTAIGVFIGAGAKLPRWLFWPVVLISAVSLAFLDSWWLHHPLMPPP